ncbi:hypothetical protein HDU84_007959, partial [Entophlyctis sp. JEL0112]
MQSYRQRKNKPFSDGFLSQTEANKKVILEDAARVRIDAAFVSSTFVLDDSAIDSELELDKHFVLVGEKVSGPQDQSLKSPKPSHALPRTANFPLKVSRSFKPPSMKPKPQNVESKPLSLGRLLDSAQEKKRAALESTQQKTEDKRDCDIESLAWVQPPVAELRNQASPSNSKSVSKFSEFLDSENASSESEVDDHDVLNPEVRNEIENTQKVQTQMRRSSNETSVLAGLSQKALIPAKRLFNEASRNKFIKVIPKQHHGISIHSDSTLYFRTKEQCD